MSANTTIVDKIHGSLTGLHSTAETIGLPKAIKNKVVSFYQRRVKKTYILNAEDSRYPLICRYNSSDQYVFETVFDQNEYGCLNDVQNVRLIVDCGANVGYSSAYFLTRFPQANIIAIEPDSNNFNIMKRNLKSYGDRVTSYNAGVWSETTGLKVCRGTYRDGLAWATQVRKCLPDETPDVQAVDIGTILRNSGFDKIDILKIDIERSEIELFARNFSHWLGKTRNLVIELHDKECEDVFYKAISGYPFTLSKSLEVVVCKSA